MKRLIKRILREEINKSDRHYKMLDTISEHVQLPYFKSMESLTIDDEDDQLYIMKKIYGYDIYFYRGEIRDENGNMVYIEYSDGDWKKWEYDDNGNNIYSEYSDGRWWEWEYDDNRNLIYYEDSFGKKIDNR